MRYTHFLIAAGVVALLATPTVGRAQITTAPAGSPLPSSGGNNGGASLVAVPMAMDTTTPKLGIPADSMAALRKFIASKQVIVFINGSVATKKGLDTLKASEIAGVTLKAATAGDIQYYGPKAKSGILVISAGKDALPKKRPWMPKNVIMGTAKAVGPVPAQP